LETRLSRQSLALVLTTQSKQEKMQQKYTQKQIRLNSMKTHIFTGTLNSSTNLIIEIQPHLKCITTLPY